MSLPSFRHPPVEEVACSMQFTAPMKLGVTSLPRMVAEFTDTYPTVQEHPPLPPILRGSERITFQMVTEGFELPRLWFINETSSRLVQLQRDRLGVNWRRGPLGEEYPRYIENVRPMLVDAWDRLVRGASALGTSEPEIGVIELMYVNPIVLAPGEGLESVLRPWSGGVGTEFTAAPRGVTMQLAYDIPSISGVLNVEVATANRIEDDTPLVLINLVARADVNGGIERALECVDVAREWIVNGFAALTTKERHDQWERIT